MQAVQGELETLVQVAAESRSQAASLGTSTFTVHCCVERCNVVCCCS